MREAAISVTRLVGAEVEPFLPELARLRIEVFCEYPYLYDGSLDYEVAYLRKYAASDRSIFVLAKDGEKVVGVSTGVPLLDADNDFQAPFLENGYAPDSIFYFGESVLQKDYRGCGLGSRFMREREAFARTFGDYQWCVFCAVQRDAEDPRRPEGYRDLRGFWAKYGFSEKAELETAFAWKEVGEADESPKRMRFWVKAIT